MRNRVYATVGCPSVRLSHHSTATATCGGGFAAERRAGWRYRSTAASALQQRRHSTGRSTALSSKCGQCHVDSRVDEAEHRLVALAVAKAVANTRSLHQGSRMAKKQNKTDMTERVSLIRMHNGRKVDALVGLVALVVASRGRT